MADATITDISGTRPNKNRGEFVYECDDGEKTSTARIQVTAEVHPGRVVYRVQPDIEKEDGSVQALNLPAGEHTFMLGEADGDPVASLQYVLEQETLRAHRAKKQLDTLAGMDLPTPAEVSAAAEIEEEELPAEPDPIGVDGGAGNDVLAEG